MTVDDPLAEAEAPRGETTPPPDPSEVPSTATDWRRVAPVVAAWLVVAALLAAVLWRQQTANADLATSTEQLEALTTDAVATRHDRVATLQGAGDRVATAEVDALDAAGERQAALAEEAAAADHLATVDEEHTRTGEALDAANRRLAVTTEQIGVLLDCVRTANAAINAASLDDARLAADILRPTSGGCALVGLAVLATATSP